MNPVSPYTERTRHRIYLAWVLSYAILFIAIVALYWQATSSASENREKIQQEGEARDIAICESSNRAKTALRDYIVTLITRSDRTIDTLAYYKKHPNEARVAHQQNKHAKKEIQTSLRAEDCDGLTNGNYGP